jgi:hypothetical protein
MGKHRRMGSFLELKNVLTESILQYKEENGEE